MTDKERIDELLKIILVALTCPLVLPLVVGKQERHKVKVKKIMRV
jgi:hypothetical protein